MKTFIDPFSANQNKKKSQPVSGNAVEQIKDLGTNIAQSATSDLVGGVARGVVEQVFGTAGKSPSSPLEVNKQAEKEIRKDERHKIELFKGQTQQEVFSYREIQVAREIKEIQFEITRIISTSKDVEVNLTKVVLAPLPEKPGEYHLTFFQWILKIVKEARIRVEESQTWLSVFVSKKKQKNYWAMLSKHGAKWGMSSERSAAMSVG